MIYDITAFGASGDGTTNDAPAIQRAIDACTTAGGGTVLVRAGRTYLTSEITLKSHVDLHVEGGATLLSSTAAADFPHESVICAQDAEDIAISGKGVIDGQGVKYMQEELPHSFVYKEPRPRLFTPIGCQRVSLHDVTFRDSAFWAIVPVGCENVVIHGINVLNNLKIRNCDGIDPENCRNVHISDCTIIAGDDCICPKSSRAWTKYGVCENITVTGCTIVSTSCAIKIGSAVNTAVRNMVVDSCIISGSNRGIGIQHRDQGVVENISFSNMIIETRLFDDVWWGKAEPIYITAIPRTPRTPLGAVRNIRFSNILCRGESGIYVRGSSQVQPEHIVFDNVRVEIDKTTRYLGGQYDPRPGELDVYEHKIAGAYIQQARDVILRDTEIAWGEHRPDFYGHALECHDVSDLRLESFRGAAAHPERDEAIKLDGIPEG